jgi:hypothetical protein
MLTRALDAGIAARWVAGDEAYGADPTLRTDGRADPGADPGRRPALDLPSDGPGRVRGGQRDDDVWPTLRGMRDIMTEGR